MERKQNILVVDDSETNLLLLEAVLGESYKVTTALSAKEAYEIIEESIPDLILLDLLMPNENGFDVIKKLRLNEDYRKIPIIIVTAFANEENSEKANKFGVTDVIEKPIDIPVFLSKVNNALNISKEIA